MTAVAPNKLFPTISFIFITEVVPENDIHRSFEAFIAVFEVHAKFIREIVCKFYCSNEVEIICSFQSCTFLEEHCRCRSSKFIWQRFFIDDWKRQLSQFENLFKFSFRKF